MHGATETHEAAQQAGCPSCHGEGTILMSTCCGRGCATCPGDGLFQQVECFRCAGSGVVAAVESPAAGD